MCRLRERGDGKEGSVVELALTVLLTCGCDDDVWLSGCVIAVDDDDDGHDKIGDHLFLSIVVWCFGNN